MFRVEGIHPAPCLIDANVVRLRALLCFWSHSVATKASVLSVFLLCVSLLHLSWIILGTNGCLRVGGKEVFGTISMRNTRFSQMSITYLPCGTSLVWYFQCKEIRLFDSNTLLKLGFSSEKTRTQHVVVFPCTLQLPCQNPALLAQPGTWNCETVQKWTILDGYTW